MKQHDDLSALGVIKRLNVIEDSGLGLITAASPCRIFFFAL
ncbi:MAG: hypothetical protein ACOY2B_04995 [Pseudomonadota bacterium]